MARISEKNPRYRTKTEIAHDIALILKMPLKHGTKYAVIKEAMWVWTEFSGKYGGCRYWSRKADRQFRRGDRSGLIHEHVVPRKVIIDLLFKMKNPTPQSVKRVLTRLLIGVVITAKEDAQLRKLHVKSMPQDFSSKRKRNGTYRNPWLRYEACKIDVIERP